MHTTQVQRLPFYVYLYFLCQTIKIMTGVISVSVVAIVGRDLSPTPMLATLPYGFQYLAMMIASYPLSVLMQKHGRKFGFFVSIVFLVCAGLTGFWAVTYRNYFLLVLAHACLGTYTAGANYFRFAASDKLDTHQKPKAVSLVIAGGLIASFAGPQTTVLLREVSGFALFSLCYGFYIFLAIINSLLLFFVPDSKIQTKTTTKNIDSTDIGLWVYLKIFIAILAAAFGAGIMGNMMIQSSLHNTSREVSFQASAFSIQLHVFAMFFPSFFLGWFIAKFGYIKIIFTGYVLLMLTGLSNMLWDNFSALVVALVFLGLGWSFSYGGGSAMLAHMSTLHLRLHKWQGIGETAIGLFSTLGAFVPSVLYTLLGWYYSNLFTLVITSCLLIGSAIMQIYCMRIAHKRGI